MLNDPTIARFRREHGRVPTLQEWLDVNYLGKVPYLGPELIQDIPHQLRDQIKDLPPEYLREKESW